MSWTLDSFKIIIVYWCHEQPVDTVEKVYNILARYGNPFVPTEAYTVDSDPFRIRSIPVDLADPEALIRLGHTTEDRKLFGFRVMLYNDAVVELRWSMGHNPEYQVDALQLSLHRDHMRSEEEAQTLLALACDLQPILMPVVGGIVDYKVEGANPVPFEYHENSHSLPERIRWANFWGPAMVERLGGMKKVMAAPTHEVRAFTDGGVLLLSTPNLLTYEEAEDTKQRQEIWQWFDLERLHKELSSIKEQERLQKRKELERASREDE